MEDKLKVGCFVIVIVIAIVGLFLRPSVCVQPAEATRVLQDAGYTEVQITGFRWFGCDHDSDFYHTGFKATGLSKRPVSGVVCSGLFFKANTIRLD